VFSPFLRSPRISWVLLPVGPPHEQVVIIGQQGPPSPFPFFGIVRMERPPFFDSRPAGLWFEELSYARGPATSRPSCICFFFKEEMGHPLSHSDSPYASFRHGEVLFPAGPFRVTSNAMEYPFCRRCGKVFFDIVFLRKVPLAPRAFSGV